MVSFRYSLQASPTPLTVFINGVEVRREAKNPTIDAIDLDLDQYPTSANFPLQRCRGNCDKGSLDKCANGLFCVTRNRIADREIPGCRVKQADKSNYCADAQDYTHGVVLYPTGSGTADWQYTEPIRVTLLKGENTVRVQLPLGQTAGPHIDRMKIMVAPSVSGTVPTTTPSFRNPPHFMSRLPCFSACHTIVASSY